MTLEEFRAQTEFHEGKPILNTYEKIYFWVEYQFGEQPVNKEEELIIDFSDTIILLENNAAFNIRKLCGNINGIDQDYNEEDKINDKEKKTFFKIRRQISFNRTIIYNACFDNILFYQDTFFMEAQFMAGADFSNSVFNEGADFSAIDISQKRHKEDKEKLPFCKGNTINFTHLHFKGPVTFNNLEWESAHNFCFHGNTYESEVRFKACSIDSPESTYYDFSNSVFKGDLIIDGSPKDKSLISRFLLSACHFHKKLKIRETTIGEIDMTNSNFHDTVNITCNTYNESSSLKFSFSRIDCLFFIDSAMGDYKEIKIKLSTEISFYKAIFTSKSFVFFRNINYTEDCPQAGILNFEYANILGNITIQDSKLDLIKLNKATVTGSINIEDVKTKFDCRESITKIKNEFIKRSDIVTSLEYKSLEMKTYRKELQGELCKIIKSCRLLRKFKCCKVLRYLRKQKRSLCKRINNSSFFKAIKKAWILRITKKIVPRFFSFIQELPNLILLGLNRISNNYGRWWLLGVFFTVIVGFIFYSFFAVASNPALEFSVDYSNWLISDSYYWKKVLCFLWLPNFDGIKELTDPQNNTSIWGCIWFFLGKIFVAYGYYQTVSAFRKYGK